MSNHHTVTLNDQMITTKWSKSTPRHSCFVSFSLVGFMSFRNRLQGRRELLFYSQFIFNCNISDSSQFSYTFLWRHETFHGKMTQRKSKQAKNRSKLRAKNEEECDILVASVTDRKWPTDT